MRCCGKWRRAAASTVALLTAVVSTAVLGRAPTALAAPPHPTAPAPGAAPLPPLPQVPEDITDGRPVQGLLSNALALSTVGIDSSALIQGVAAIQAKLDSDATTARAAERKAAAAAARATRARGSAREAESELRSTDGALKAAVLFLYTSGQGQLTVSPRAGRAALFAEDYAQSTLGPYGVLEQRRHTEQVAGADRRLAEKQERAAGGDLARASKAVSAEEGQIRQLDAELASLSKASAGQVAADHVALAAQVSQELKSSAGLQFEPSAPLPSPLPTTPVALAWAFAELGKPYVWGATGPGSFDCSGLTQYVWKAAGVSIPRVAADQDAWAIPVPLSQLLPGDLVFFGTTDIHHVGIYIGDGLMINAPHTGDVVRVSSIWWSDLAGFGRVHAPGTPVPPHMTPTPSAPAPAVVLANHGPVPSQTAPPPGWTPHPGSTSPIGPASPDAATTGGTTTTTASTTTSTTMPSTAISSTTISSTTMPSTTLPSITMPSTTSTTSSSAVTQPTTTTTVPPGR